MVSGFLATNSGVAAISTGIRSTFQKSMIGVAMPSASAIEL